MSDLDALIAKVEGAKEGDEALDLAIFLALHPDDPTVAKWAKTLAAMDDFERVHWASRFIDLPHYTSSLDAIVKLVEAKLPGWSWTIRSKDTPENDPYGDRQVPSALVYVGLTTSSMTRRLGGAQGPTPAIALCLALLRALAQEEGKP